MVFVHNSDSMGGMTVMAKTVTTLEICENAKLARDMVITGKFDRKTCVRMLTLWFHPHQ